MIEFTSPVSAGIPATPIKSVTMYVAPITLMLMMSVFVSVRYQFSTMGLKINPTLIERSTAVMKFSAGKTPRRNVDPTSMAPMRYFEEMTKMAVVVAPNRLWSADGIGLVAISSEYSYIESGNKRWNMKFCATKPTKSMTVNRPTGNDGKNKPIMTQRVMGATMVRYFLFQVNICIADTNRGW